MKAFMNNPAINPTGALSSSAFGNPFLFTGRRLDDRTGLYYYRNRYYEPASGRFISRDPEEYIDGLNCYAYSKNNSMNFKDSWGTEIIPGDGTLDGCDGYVYVYSEMSAEHKTKIDYAVKAAQNEARELTVEELKKKETEVREYAIQQCKNAGKKKGTTCLLQGQMTIAKKSIYDTNETRASRRARREHGKDRCKRTEFVTTARTPARIRCMSITTLLDELDIATKYVNQDLEAIKKEEDKRDKVRDISGKLLVVAGALKVLKWAWGGGSGVQLGIRGSALSGLGVP